MSVCWWLTQRKNDFHMPKGGQDLRNSLRSTQFWQWHMKLQLCHSPSRSWRVPLHQFKFVESNLMCLLGFRCWTVKELVDAWKCTPQRLDSSKILSQAWFLCELTVSSNRSKSFEILVCEQRLAVWVFKSCVCSEAASDYRLEHRAECEDRIRPKTDTW